MFFLARLRSRAKLDGADEVRNARRGGLPGLMSAPDLNPLLDRGGEEKLTLLELSGV